VDRALLDDVVELTREAGELTMRWFRADDLVIDRKGDGTPVTDADRAAERFLREQLTKRYPDDGIAGEEEVDVDGTSGRRWIIDPIDGTKAFTHGVPTFSNLVALEDEHGPAIGVINLPALHETVYAGRGCGCWCDGKEARVSLRGELPGGYLTTSGFESWDERALLAARGSGMRLRTWGDGYGYALVATGRVDAMVDPVVEPYDVAAMPVILAEAGGRFTDLTGAPRIDGGSGLATNGALHDRMLEMLAAP
jgi:histidinol phosphatase-like enzyme (inositol monophosphatase family)